MRPTIARWIGDADGARYQQQFRVAQANLDFAHISARADDFYIALVGELFDALRGEYADRDDWARLGNALGQYATGLRLQLIPNTGVSPDEAALLGAAAFYRGGFPASAFLAVRDVRSLVADEATLACLDLLGRPTNLRSEVVARLLDAVRRGDLEAVANEVEIAGQRAQEALIAGPEAWAVARVVEELVSRFARTNVRAVLPGGTEPRWTPFVESLLDRDPPLWDFFPSQIEAIERGLLTSGDTFSLQMPTGAGKTSLCETLLYWNAVSNPGNVAVLLVPYRSLAAELRNTVVLRLNALGVSARCQYGGTVPSGDEVRSLEELRVLVATPETLSGILSAEPNFFRRISLVICDEGHLLASRGRGVGLELLLARMRAREGGAPRFVFVSAIVPNIEEINHWLGGTRETVVRSDYRPAVAEYALLKAEDSRADLVMHPHVAPPIQFTLEAFLTRDDFRWRNSVTGRQNTLSPSIKRRAVAAASKALPLGAVALFAANKRGKQGAIGLAEELLLQIEHELPLPRPLEFCRRDALPPVVEYLTDEFGAGWVGTRTLAAGAVLHHGDIPQEVREVLEALVRRGEVKLAICTNTLAEGVNLPIRTMVLYSVERRLPTGRAESLLTRDIKNLVGRAGRAGATTKGLVICANEQQWPLVRAVARQAGGEPVTGALAELMRALRSALAYGSVALSNTVLEASVGLLPLVDGIDATLVDLAAEELGEEALVAIAVKIADQTFAALQADAQSRQLLETVLALRARRVYGIRAAGRLTWLRESGARARLLDSVENHLLPSWDGWDTVVDPMSPELFSAVMNWAWAQPELQLGVREAYQLKDGESTDSRRTSFFSLVREWISGARYRSIADRGELDLDAVLAVSTRAVGYALQTLVEQAVTLLGRLAAERGTAVSLAVAQFPEHLRFGVPSTAGVVFCAAGIRHRWAAVALGSTPAVGDLFWAGAKPMLVEARDVLRADEREWRSRLGNLVYQHTLQDLKRAIR